MNRKSVGFDVNFSKAGIVMPREHERVDFIAQIALDSALGKREVRVSDISAGGCVMSIRS